MIITPSLIASLELTADAPKSESWNLHWFWLNFTDTLTKNLIQLLDFRRDERTTPEHDFHEQLVGRPQLGVENSIYDPHWQPRGQIASEERGWPDRGWRRGPEMTNRARDTQMNIHGINMTYTAVTRPFLTPGNASSHAPSYALPEACSLTDRGRRRAENGAMR